MLLIVREHVRATAHRKRSEDNVAEPVLPPTFPWGLGFEPWLSGLRREHFDPLSYLAGPRQAIFRHESGRNGLGNRARLGLKPCRSAVGFPGIAYLISVSPVPQQCVGKLGV